MTVRNPIAMKVFWAQTSIIVGKKYGPDLIYFTTSQSFLRYQTSYSLGWNVRKRKCCFGIDKALAHFQEEE